MQEAERKKAGFTLIELVMVIVIIGILAAVAIPRFESYFVIKLDGAAKKAVSDIRYTQQLAIARHEDYRIIFDSVNNNYEVRRVSDNSFAIDPFTRADFSVNFNTDSQYKGISIQNDAVFQFDWQGVPVAGGSVSLEYHDNLRTISVEPETGMVSVQ